MARTVRRRRRRASVASSIRGLLDVVADRVVYRVQRSVAARAQVRDLERQVRVLSRRVEAGLARIGPRRVGRPRSNRRCKVKRCGLPHVAHGFCSRHYQAWRRRMLKARAARRR